MKTLFTLLLFSMSAISTIAQNTEKEEYLIAKIKVKSYPDSYLLYIDYSRAKGKDYTAPDDPVQDSLGNSIKFKSESAALNYLARESWVLISVIPQESFQGTTSWRESKYVFRRKITNENSGQIKSTAE